MIALGSLKSFDGCDSLTIYDSNSLKDENCSSAALLKGMFDVDGSDVLSSSEICWDEEKLLSLLERPEGEGMLGSMDSVEEEEVDSMDSSGELLLSHMVTTYNFVSKQLWDNFWIIWGKINQLSQLLLVKLQLLVN